MYEKSTTITIRHDNVTLYTHRGMLSKEETLKIHAVISEKLKEVYEDREDREADKSKQ